jgi:iron complex transport system substrate-binding protein
VTRKTLPTALLLAILCAAPSVAAPQSYTVIDTLGRSVSFLKVPERIVIAGRATLLLVDAVYLFPGAGQRVIGVGMTDQGLGDFFPFLDPQAAGKTRFANSVGPEQLAGQHPDLVILKSYMKEKLGDPLEKIGIPVLYLDLESAEKFSQDVQTLGSLFQQPERARWVLDWYTRRVDAVSRAVAGAPRPSALLVQYSARDGTNAFSVPPAGWIQTFMVETAGGTALWRQSGPGDGWKKIGLEQLSAWNPRFVFVVSYQSPAPAIAADLRKMGVLAGDISGFPADYSSWDQADSRWILGMEWMAVTLHPDLFPGMDMRREAAAFFEELYGMDQGTVARVVLPRLEGALARK